MTSQGLARCGNGLAFPTKNASRNHRGILRRVVDAIVLSRQRRADREVARFLGIPEGSFNDQIERRIMRHITRNSRFRP